MVVSGRTGRATLPGKSKNPWPRRHRGSGEHRYGGARLHEKKESGQSGHSGCSVTVRAGLVKREVEGVARRGPTRAGPPRSCSNWGAPCVRELLHERGGRKQTEALRGVGEEVAPVGGEGAFDLFGGHAQGFVGDGVGDGPLHVVVVARGLEQRGP